VLAFVASLVLLSSPGSAVSTLVVDDDGLAALANCDAVTPTYSSINAAIADAGPGDTIQVCPGLYAEMVNINKDNLKLLGAQAGVDARTRPFVPNPMTQSIIDHPCGPVQITADNDTLDGFTVQGSITDPNADPACFGAGIWTNPGFSGSQGGHQIQFNIVQDNISGIELDSECSLLTAVQFNLIQNNNIPGAGSGNGIQTNFGLCNATIERNLFRGHTSSSMLISVPSRGLDVTSNELGAGLERIIFGAVSSSVIRRNFSFGSTQPNGTIRLWGGNRSISVDNNTLLRGVIAIGVDDPFGIGPNLSVTAHQNCIAGNTMAGMRVLPGGHPGVLDAENNWWGNASGPMHPTNPPGTGDRVIDSWPLTTDVVDFTPWLPTDPGPPCPAAPPPPNTPGKVTGGGYIDGTGGGGTTGGTTGGIAPLDPVMQLAEVLILQSSNPASRNTKATFGFTITCCDPKGNLQYDDHGASVRIKATRMTNLVITDPSPACPTGKHAQFKGEANETTSSGTTPVIFTVDVDDCDEPGSSPGAGPDTFKIETTSGYMAGGPLVGGNIQIHRD
jgi:hypothetical protein